MPLSWVYRFFFTIRKLCYQVGIFSSYKAKVPVIVVGNLTVGGTGKTPLVIYLVELLREQGYSPAVISRGYSGDAPSYPFEVTAKTPVEQSGDEPALIVKRTKVPMVVGPNRGANIDLLLASNEVDVIVSDDGLQHFALQRDIEVCLVDDTVPTNNQSLLPAGPYREPLSRLKTVDMIVHHQQKFSALDKGRFGMALVANEALFLNEKKQDQKALSKSDVIHAVAGIGNPQRFFNTCKLQGYQVQEHAFPDHYHFQADDLEFNDGRAVLMTEKDAVKCQYLKGDNLWYLPVDAQLSEGFTHNLIDALNKLKR